MNLDELMDRGTQPVAKTDTVDDAMDAYDGAQIGAVRAGATIALDSNPDEIARQKRIAQSLGVPLAAVEADPAFASREQRMRSIEQATAKSPVLRQKFGEADFAKLASYDVENLSAIEELWRSVKRGFTGRLKGFDADAVDDASLQIGILDRIERGDIKTKIQLRDANGGGNIAPIMLTSPTMRAELRKRKEAQFAENAIEFNRRKGELAKLPASAALDNFYRSKGAVNAFSALFDAPVEVATNIVAESIGTMAPTIPAVIAGGFAGGARGLAAIVGPASAQTEYASAIAGELEKSGIDITDIEAVKAFVATPAFAEVRRKAGIKAVTIGTVDALTAGMTGTQLFKSAAGNLAAQTWLQATGGALGEVAGSVLSGQEINAASVIAEAIGEVPSAFVDVAVMAGRHALTGQRRAEQAEQSAKFIENINKLATADKLLERDDQTFESFVATVSEDGPVDTVYVDGRMLMQSGLSPALAELSPSVREQLDRAILTGGDIAIPVAEYMTKIAKTDLAPQLKDHIRLGGQGFVDDFTLAEARDWKENFGAELQDEVELAIGNSANADTFRASQDVVKQDILGQLNTAARFTPQVNEAYATLTSARTAVRAAQMGITPEEFHQRYGVKVQGEAVAGDRFDQASEQISYATFSGKLISQYGIDNADAIALNAGSQANAAGNMRIADINSAIQQRVRELRAMAVEEVFKAQEAGTDRMRVVMRKRASELNGRAKQLEALSLDNLLSEPKTSDPNILNQSAFYSQLSRAIESAPDKVFTTATQFKLWLNSNAAKLGIKKDEIVWSGIEEFLDMQGKGKVSKADVVGFLSASGVKVEDVVLGDDKAAPLQARIDEINDRYNEIIDQHGVPVQDLPKEVKAEIDRLTAEHDELADRVSGMRPNDDVTKFSGYIPPGGIAGTYREILVTLPVRTADVTPQQALEDIKRRRMSGEISNEEADRLSKLAYSDKRGGSNTTIEQNSFRSGHFDQPNILVHLRTDEVTGADGKRYLRVVEIQSDWGQKGKKEGFVKKYTPEDVIAITAKDDPAAAQPDLFWYFRVPDNILQIPKSKYATEADARAYIVRDKKSGGEVAPAPFVTDTRAWVSLGIKRAIQHAVSSGVDGIVFATGQQNADLYDLSKQVDRVEWYPSSKDGFGDLQAFKNSESVIFKDGISNKELPDIIGKDAADRLINNPDDKTPGKNGNTHTISGESLKVGGEGMRAFYDTIVPSAANEVLKKLGGGKVSDILIGSGTPLYASLGKVIRDGTENPGFLIPESLKAKVQEGLALFQSGDTNRGAFSSNMFEVFGKNGKTLGFVQANSRDEAIAKAGRTNKLKGFDRVADNPVGLISLLQNADLTTFMHESAHYFFQSDIQLASELLGKAELTPGEQQIVDDVSKLMTWHGIQGDITEQLQQWHTMDFEEQRASHERTAESFESYLFSGKAPSLELQPIFQRFASWMVNVYKSLKAFLDKHPEAGKLNDEVRGIFDRMIATREHIALTEQARSMIAMFASPDTSGMTPEAFASYQANGIDATNTAIDELQAKGLRDMQWLHNARGKQIKKLQKQSRAARAEVMMEARREVMSQPVYRAWDFLTRKMSADDKLPPLERKSDPDILDPTLDSLFVAIAKLGGIQKDQVISEWGTDPKDAPQSGVFSKPVWRLTDGLPFDAMAESLAQHGYLPLNEHGQYDLSDFEDRFLEELSGNTQYSIEYDYEAGRMLPGDQISNPDGLGAGRLDLAGLADIDIPAEIIAHLVNLKMTAKEGLHPDLAATMFEFESGDDLVRTIAAAPTPKDAINGLADQMMLERFGELSSPDAIERAADQAIHNDVRARMLTTEANALSKAIGKPKILAAAAKAFAADMIARLKVRDLRPSQYANAETRASKAAAKAEKAGDIDTAATEKRNQVIQHYATRAAYDAQDEVATVIQYMNRITRPAALKNMRGEPRAQILAILDRFDIRKSLSLKEIDRQQSLADWALAEAERLVAPPPLLSEAVANEAIRTHYKNLTMTELRGLVDSIKQLEHMARREQKAYIAIRNMTLKEEIANGVAEIREAWPDAFDAEGKAKADTPLTHRYVPTIGSKITKGLQYANAQYVPMEELVDQLTAGKFGLLHDSLFGRISNASDQKSIMAEAIRARLKPAYDAYSFTEKRDFSRKVVADGKSRENILMLMLHYGNVQGRQRLASSGFDDQKVLGLLRHLTDKDINLAEAIWSLNDDYIWPMYAALNERTQGKAPAKVEALPMQVNGRDIGGGYVKLVYDAQFDEKTRRRDTMDDAMAMIAGRGLPTKTDQGSSIERIDNLSKMPMLELRAMSRALNEHMHDIAYREAIADTVRVLRDPVMSSAITAVAGDAVHTELLTKLNEVARGQRDPADFVMKVLDIARRNTVVVLLSGVKTALINYSGLVPAMNRVSAWGIVKNTAKMHSFGMREMIAFAKANSPYMRERNQQYTSDLQHEMASLTVQNRIIPEMGTFLILMRLVDQVTSTIVWTSGYEDGMVKFKDHDRAVEYANNVTRGTQGSGRDVDTSKIMANPLLKPFTMFFSFFNRQGAILIRQGVITRQQWNSGHRAKAVGRFTAAYILIVAIPALINDLAQGRCDDAIEGDDGWGKCVGKAITMNMAGMVPILRDFVPYVWRKLDDDEPDFSLRATPIEAYFKGLGDGISSTVDVVKDENDEKDTKSIFMGLAFAFRLPGKLLWDTTAGTEAVINDDAPPQSILFGPPKD